MLNMSEEELVEAMKHLGDGVHSINIIENQVVKDRHDKNKKSRRKKKLKK